MTKYSYTVQRVKYDLSKKEFTKAICDYIMHNKGFGTEEHCQSVSLKGEILSIEFEFHSTNRSDSKTNILPTEENPEVQGEEGTS